MMPDISQHGSGESQEWKPVENTTVILFDRVSKSYGKITKWVVFLISDCRRSHRNIGNERRWEINSFKLMMWQD